MVWLDNINRDTSSINDEVSLDAPSLRDAFFEWLSAGNTKKYSPVMCISCFDKVSEYAVQKKICSFSLWSVTQHSVFQPIYNRLLEAKMLRVTEKNTYKAFILAGQLYLRFLKDKAWLKAAVEQSSTTTIDDIIETDASVSDIDKQTLNNSTAATESSTNVNPDDFVTWLIMQKNSRGTLYLERVARKYSQYLRSAPPKLDISLTPDKRDVYACRTIEKFDRLWEIFLAAPNFKQVNEYGHQTFSAGLKAYRRYLESLDEQGENVKSEENLSIKQTSTVIAKELNDNVRRVDFSYTVECSGSDPISCSIDDVNITFVGNWRDLLVAVTEYCIVRFAEKMENLKAGWFSNHTNTPFLLVSKPISSGKKLSNGNWINVHYSISQLVLIIAGVCRYCEINLNNVEITYTPKSNTKGCAVEQGKTDDSSVYAQQNIRSEFREWLSELNSAWSNSTLNMLCSDALYLYNNNRGITFEEALTDNEGIEKAYNALEKHFTSNPRQTGTAAAKGYIDSLQLFKEFIKERFSNLLDGDGGTSSTPQIMAFPDSIVSVLTQDYPYGFNFDTTSVRLLAEKSGVDFSASIQNALEKLMFCRNDGIYFLLDVVANSETRQEIIGFAGDWLYNYGCFEISELYALFAEKVNEKAIRNLYDFETFYEFINGHEVRCVAYYGTRMARVHNKSIRDLSLNIAEKVISIAHDEYGGTVNEDDLRDRFPAFSADLLGNIIKEHAEELVKTEINGIICYQTLDALGLSDEFSDTLTEVLEQIDDVGLIPDEEVLHTALSIRLGVNFKAEYNVPDDKTYRRLIAAYYKGAPKREWKRSIFAEV